MRILAIRGENLASLCQPFSIDFDAEPLTSTGLFAITGETGSGKSTILDALCLALYGGYPRFTSSQQDALPDPSGSKVSIPDGSTILRRGTGKGYAEVEFIGQDTQRYRARWEAHRAHKKPDGVIQIALRTLHVVQGSTLTPIANTKTAVQKVVDAQTGLTFDQFCRTVLLPQGEFDAFLLAQKTERGALLEKITGTEIYGRISKIVYARTRKLNGEAEQLETRLADLGVLPDTDRTTIEQDFLKLQREVISKTSEQQMLQSRIAILDNIAVAQQRLAAAEQDLLDACNNAQMAVADRDRLAELQAVEPLRSLRDRLSVAVREQGPAERKSTVLKEGLQQALANASNAKTALDSAREAHNEAEQSFKDFAPVWDEAARLDNECANAEAEAKAARSAAEVAREALSDVDAELGKLAEQISQAERERESATVTLGNHSHLINLVDELSNVETLFERYESCTVESARLNEQRVEAEQVVANLGITVSARDAELDTKAGFLQKASDTAKVLQNALEDSKEEMWQTEESELTNLQRQARDAEQLAKRYQSAASLLHRARAEYAEAINSTAASAARLQTAEASFLEQTTRRHTIQRNSELAEESLGQRNAHLRSLLVDGESCPICGATQHPYTAPGKVDALSSIAENLRRERSAIDAEISLLNLNVQRATADRTTAEGQADNAKRVESQAISDMQGVADEFITLRAKMEQICAHFDFITPLPGALTEDTHAASLVSALLANIEERRVLASQHVTDIKEVRRKLDEANKAIRNVQAAVNASTQLREVERESLHNAELIVVRASEGSKQAAGRLHEIENTLSPYLEAADISLEPLQSSASDVLTVLRKLAGDVVALRARTAELSSQVDLHVENQRRLVASQRNLADRVLDLANNLERREDAYRDLSEARAILLGGEPTAQHRDRINSARLNAQMALQSAQTSESSTATSLATVTEQERFAAESLVRVLSELATAETVYGEACSSLGIESTRVDELLATPYAETSALTARLEALDRAIHDTERTLADRRSFLQSLPTSENNAQNRDQYLTTIENLTTDLNLSLQNIGNLRGRLDHDDALLVKARDLRSQSDEKVAELTTWQQVEDAIGSANGDRFRTFAQSLTLEQLVQLANDHLNSLSRRYQLACSPDADLSLHVIDKDMGEEHRAIRSLSGGERFLVSLSLALSLSGLEGREFSVDTLFIDEGFGSLDTDTLDLAITALETLHSRGRKVGVITHVAAMIESIPVQIKVEKLGGGSSIVRLQSAAAYV